MEKASFNLTINYIKSTEIDLDAVSRLCYNLVTLPTRDCRSKEDER